MPSPTPAAVSARTLRVMIIAAVCLLLAGAFAAFVHDDDDEAATTVEGTASDEAGSITAEITFEILSVEADTARSRLVAELSGDVEGRQTSHLTTRLDNLLTLEEVSESDVRSGPVRVRVQSNYTAALRRATPLLVEMSRPGGTMRTPVEAGWFIDKGLIGFDVGTGSDIVRPELLRLVKTGQPKQVATPLNSHSPPDHQVANCETSRAARPRGA